MEWSQILGFVAVAALLVVSPGPNGLLIAKTVPTSGKSAGFANVAGFVGGFYLHGAFSALGLSLILMQSAQAFFVLKMVGAAYLCWIGVKALMSAFETKKNVEVVEASSTSSKTGHFRAFIEGFLTNSLNPKVSMFYLAAFPQFIPAVDPIGSAFLLITIHSIMNFIWFSSMVLLFASFSGATKNERFQRWLKATTGVVFIGFGAKLATMRS